MALQRRADFTYDTPYERSELTAQEVRSLTLYKWTYSLESAGFTREEAEHLLFWKWMYNRKVGRLA